MIKNKNRGGIIDRQRKRVGVEKKGNSFLSPSPPPLMFVKRTKRKNKTTSEYRVNLLQRIYFAVCVNVS